MKRVEKWACFLENNCNRYLSWRKWRKMEHRRRQVKKNQLLDWLHALIWSVCVILIINQYFIQSFVIPSGSMEDSLKINDRVVVNKLIYGPELIPGIGKLPSPWRPERNDIIIFTNPAYTPRFAEGSVQNTLFTIAQRLIFMLTFTLVDIDRDENGNSRAFLLVKRGVGVAGDRLRLRDGNLQLAPPGFDRFVGEDEFKQLIGADYQQKRLLKPDYYQALRQSQLLSSYAANDLPLPGGINIQQLRQKLNDSSIVTDQRGSYLVGDRYASEHYRYQNLHRLAPATALYRQRYWQKEMGWHLKEGQILPLGDNRDNSNDGRYFGILTERNILGENLLIFWPPFRMGLTK